HLSACAEPPATGRKLACPAADVLDHPPRPARQLPLANEGEQDVTKPAVIKPDPKLDLVLERVIDVPRELVWTAWTTPKHLLPWFCPKPWTTIDCEIDLRPGGIFRSVMRSPEGKEFPNVGCYLEVVPHERLIWTDALLPG